MLPGPNSASGSQRYSSFLPPILDTRDTAPSGASDNRARVGGDTRPQVRAFLRHRACDGRPLHLPLVVDDDSGVVLEIDKNPIFSAPRLPLPDHHSRHHLLTQLGLPFSHGRHDHIPQTCLGQPIQSAFHPSHGNDVQVLGSGVI